MSPQGFGRRCWPTVPTAGWREGKQPSFCLPSCGTAVKHGGLPDPLRGAKPSSVWRTTGPGVNPSMAHAPSFPVGRTGRQYLRQGCRKALLHVGLRGAESPLVCSPVDRGPPLCQVLESILPGRCLCCTGDLDATRGSKSHHLRSSYLCQPQAWCLHVWGLPSCSEPLFPCGREK